MRVHIALALIWLAYSTMCALFSTSVWAFTLPAVGGAFMAGINAAAYWDSVNADET